MAESDGLRKAMGKKLPAVMAEYRDRFIAGCDGNGIDKQLAGEIFDMIERFSGYGFVKVPQCRLRRHHRANGVPEGQIPGPVHGGTDEHRNREHRQDRVQRRRVPPRAAFRCCRRASIRVAPSTRWKQFEGREAIRFGLAAVKNVGMGAVESIDRVAPEQLRDREFRLT